MPLLLGQLVYTSFPRVGFRTLASAQVSPEIQQVFIRQIVYQYWNSYNPPELGYKAAYLHQISQEEILFGWVYNDGLDDLGRSHVPYFICYYLAEPLHPVQLEHILTCLHRGPVVLIDRQCPPAVSETILASDWWSYQPARMGVAISPEVRERSYAELKQGRLLDLFIPPSKPEMGTELNGLTYNHQKATLPTHTRHLVIEGIEVSGLDTKESTAEVKALESQDEYQEVLQLYAQALKMPSTGATIGLRKTLATLNPGYKNSWLLIGIGIAAVLALTVTTYLPLRQQVSQPLQTTATVEPKASWQNVRAETLSGHAGTVWSVAISPDSQTLASGSSDGTIKLWDLGSGVLLNTLGEHAGTVWSVAISPDSQTLASGSSDGTVKLRDLGSGELLRTLEGHRGAVWSVAISPDGQTLASGSSDGTIKLWDLGSGVLLRTLEGHTDAVRSIAFAPSAGFANSFNGQTLASGSSDGTIKLWDLGSGELLRTLKGHSDRVISIAISPDGKLLASGSVDKTVKVWRLSNGTLLRTLSGHSDWANSVAISPDGAILAGGVGDITKIWDLATGELLYTLPRHSSDITSVCFSTNGKQLASGSQDKTINILQQ